MAKPQVRVSELVEAASAVDDEVHRLEEMTAAARKIRLSTEKSLSRASRAMTDALAQQEQIATKLRALAEAMVAVQRRQERAVEGLAARAAEIRERTTAFAEHMREFALVGQEAGEITLLLHDVVSDKPSDGDAASRTASAARLAEVDVRMARLAQQAEELMVSAAGADMPEIEKQAESVMQPMRAAHQRPGFAKRTLST